MLPMIRKDRLIRICSLPKNKLPTPQEQGNIDRPFHSLQQSVPCRNDMQMGTTTTTAASTHVDKTSTTRSPQQSSAKRRHEDRRRHKRKALLGSLKRFCVYVLAGTAIASSVLVIYSCTFFSYRVCADTADYNYNYDDDDNDFRNHAMKSSIDYNDNDREEPDRKEQDYYVESLSYSPFEHLSEAGVGLFSYYVGDSSEAGTFTAEDTCFRYYDEATEYNLFTKSSTAHGRTIDLWIAARYCSIFAPVVAALAFAQLLLELCCDCRLARYGSFVTTLLFLIAGALQFGTFAVTFAPPTLSSEVPGVNQERFCFSSESTIQCRVDTGAWISLGSAIAYIVLAFSSATLRTTRYSDAHNSGEHEDSTNIEYCSGCCIVSKPSPDRRIKSNTKKKCRTREHGDTTSDSSFSSSNDENDDSKKGQLESNSDEERQKAHSVRWGSDLSNDRGIKTNQGNIMEMEKNKENEDEDTLGFYDEDLANTIEDDILSKTLETDGTALNQQNADETTTYENDDGDSIIKEVTSIETDFVRPGAACCYCTETVIEPPLQLRHAEKKTTAGKRIIPNNKKWQMESMLSEDDDKDEENDEREGDAIEENTTTVYGENSTTVEECEAMFMAELESAQCGNHNWENSNWKKGFDFVRS
jgi:hypothetical protein